MQGMPFVNRKAEISNIFDFLLSPAEVSRVTVLTAAPGCGLTHLLRHIHDMDNPQLITVYSDMSDGTLNSIFSDIVLALADASGDFLENFSSWIDSKRPAVAGRLRAGLSSLPWVGNALQGGQGGTEPMFHLTGFPSIAASIVCEFLLCIPQNKNLAIIVDNAQELDEWSMDLVRATSAALYSNVKFIFGFMLRNRGDTHEVSEFLERTSGLGFYPQRLALEEPNGHLVRSIGQILDVDISDQQAEALVAASGGSIYRILAGVRALKGSCLQVDTDPTDTLNPTTLRILQLLSVAGQSLRSSDISTMLANQFDGEFFDVQIEPMLVALQTEQLVDLVNLPDGDLLITLRSNDWVRSISKETPVERLHIANALYEYARKLRRFSRRHSESELLPLLYRTSKLIDPSSSIVWGREIIRLSMQMGSIEAAKRFLEQSVSTKLSLEVVQTFEDFLLVVCFYMAARRYSKALQLLQIPANAEWSQSPLSKSLFAICLNRCRRHDESDFLIEEMLTTGVTTEVKALLASYLVVSKLHSNKVLEARSIFTRYSSSLEQSKNIAYLLRNGASCFQAQTSIDISKRATELFREADDMFGYASTLTNLACSCSELGDCSVALAYGQEAAEILETFGVFHLHIVKNDLGIFNMQLSLFEEAEHNLRTALKVAKTSMPTLFIQMNMALCSLLKGDVALSLSQLGRMEEQVQNHPVDRVRQRYYINSAIAAKYAGSSDFENFCALAEGHPDRMSPSITRNTTALLRSREIARLDLLRLIQPCYLLYWYQNPLEAIPEEALALATVTKDMSY